MFTADMMLILWTESMSTDQMGLQHLMLNLHSSHPTLSVLIPSIETALKSTQINTVTLFNV